jgi:hypothetical protein
MEKMAGPGDPTVAAVAVGDRVKVYWGDDGDDDDGCQQSKSTEGSRKRKAGCGISGSHTTCEVIEVKRRATIKNDSQYTYTLQNVKDATDVRKTRLAHLKYKVKKMSANVVASSETNDKRLPNHSLILAPMVNTRRIDHV